MKLTDNQKAVVMAMRKGANIYSHKNEHFGAKGQTVYQSRTYDLDSGDGYPKRLHHSTIFSLYSRGLILLNKSWELTTLGKSVEL